MQRFQLRINNLTKYHYRWLIALTLMLFTGRAWGQSIEEADTIYKEFMQMRADTAYTKEQIYNKALECSQMYRHILIASPAGTGGYSQSQSVLKALYPFLKAGAGFNSQNGNDSLAMDFARVAVDVGMMKEMKDQGIRQDDYYQTLVYFVASRDYNAEQYESAIKYLTEYLDVTDVSKHPPVLTFLENAKGLLAQQQQSKAKFHDVNQGVPDFDVFAKESIEKSIKEWQQKDPYETVEEFRQRVNEETVKTKQQELQKILMDEYIQRFAHNMTVADMEIKPYDADHQSFLITSPYGDIVLAVPRDSNQARDFAESWADVKVYNQDFVISNKKLALARMTFSTPAGKIYTYNNQEALAWSDNDITVNIDIDTDKLINSDGSKSQATISKQEVVVGKSDVDVNIPQYKRVNDKTFAVIIANENYTAVPKVPMAGNDGAVFAQYCEQTLGLPKENIRQYPNATYGEMIRAIQDIKTISQAYNNDIRVIFFYAGHGIPNESTRDAFLLPIDADGGNTEVCYPLKKLYGELSALGAQSVVVFLDACFSGTTGEGGTLMANARGVALKARQEKPSGNLVVFSAASDDETAYPYAEQKHGLFTYYLLKKLQDSKGNATLGELSKYIIDNVKQRSVLVNHKIQTPTVSSSADMQDDWKNLKLR